MRIDCCVSYFQKQLIGLLPNESECFFYYTPNVDVNGWTIDGTDSTDVGSVNGILNPYGYIYNFFALGDGTYRFILSYIGTTPPSYLPVILDSGSNPVTWTLTNCCDKVCLEGTFNSADALYFQTGYGWNWYNGAGTFGHPSVEEAIKSLYGPQTIYTATNNGDGTFYIKIDNAYVCNLSLAWSGDNIVYLPMYDCQDPCFCLAFFSKSDYSGNYPTSDFAQYYMDPGLTQQAFNLPGDGKDGGGALRTYLESKGGGVYGVYHPLGYPNDFNYFLYYYGNPQALKLFFTGGYDYVTFYRFDDNIFGYNYPCTNTFNYCATVDYGVNAIRFTAGNLYLGVYPWEYDNSFSPNIYPTGTTSLDLTDTILMSKFVQNGFGPAAIYKITDTGSNYYIQILNALNYGSPPYMQLNNLSDVFFDLC